MKECCLKVGSTSGFKYELLLVVAYFRLAINCPDTRIDYSLHNHIIEREENLKLEGLEIQMET